MYQITISEDMRRRAKDAQDRIMQIHQARGGVNPWGHTEPDRWYTGFLGEFVFEQYLRIMDKNHHYRPEFNGQADDGDFIMWSNSQINEITGQPQAVRIDVKTGGKLMHKWMCMPAGQYSKYAYDVYVGVRLDEDKTVGQVMGWALKTDLKPCDPKLGDQYGMPYENLRDMDKLNERLL